MFSISGKLIVKNDAEQITDKFRKREFVVSDESSQYPQEIIFQLVQDKVDLLDPFNEGDQIKVNFNLRGRRWENPKTGETRFFNSLDAWRLEKESAGSTTSGSDLPPMPSSEPIGVPSDDSDDLPF
jgi:single-stranded DNA-binding protein